MSSRIDITAARETEVAVPDGQALLDLYHNADEHQPGQRALVIGDPGAAAYAVTGTPAELRLFALRVLATVLGLPQDGGLLPGPDPDLNPLDPPSPAGDVVVRLMDAAEEQGAAGGRGQITDYRDVAAVQVSDGPTGEFLLACVPVPR
jgi:hypothetical protein